MKPVVNIMSIVVWGKGKTYVFVFNIFLFEIYRPVVTSRIQALVGK